MPQRRNGIGTPVEFRHSDVEMARIGRVGLIEGNGRSHFQHDEGDAVMIGRAHGQHRRFFRSRRHAAQAGGNRYYKETTPRHLTIPNNISTDLFYRVRLNNIFTTVIQRD